MGILDEVSTSTQNIADNMPKGIVPRIENQSSHREFLKDNPFVKWIMIDIQHAEALVKQGHTALSAFGPTIKVITTTTIADNILVKYHLERELGIIKEFKPHCHVPCDRPDYLSQGEGVRLQFVKSYADELLRFAKEIKGYGVVLIPLIKGLTHAERKICYCAFDALNITYVSYYGAQYFGRGRGCHSAQLVSDIREVVAETSIKNILIIGALSIDCLETLPPQVVAASGLHQWIINSGLNRVPIDAAQRYYSEWSALAEKKLGCGQDVLRDYN